VPGPVYVPGATNTSRQPPPKPVTKLRITVPDLPTPTPATLPPDVLSSWRGLLAFARLEPALVHQPLPLEPPDAASARENAWLTTTRSDAVRDDRVSRRHADTRGDRGRRPYEQSRRLLRVSDTEGRLQQLGRSLERQRLHDRLRAAVHDPRRDRRGMDAGADDLGGQLKDHVLVYFESTSGNSSAHIDVPYDHFTQDYIAARVAFARAGMDAAEAGDSDAGRAAGLRHRLRPAGRAARHDRARPGRFTIH
jgi:hypothetical protein